MDKQALDEIIKSLKEKFKQDGRVTYDDVNASLSAGNVDPNEIDDILSALSAQGIEVKSRCRNTSRWAKRSITKSSVS